MALGPLRLARICRSESYVFPAVGGDVECLQFSLVEHGAGELLDTQLPCRLDPSSPSNRGDLQRISKTFWMGFRAWPWLCRATLGGRLCDLRRTEIPELLVQSQVRGQTQARLAAMPAIQPFLLAVWRDAFIYCSPSFGGGSGSFTPLLSAGFGPRRLRIRAFQ